MRHWKPILLCLVCATVLGGCGTPPGESPPPPITESAQPEPSAVFQQRYQAWRDYIEESGIGFRSDTEPYTENQPFRDIVALGVPALPFIMDEEREGRSVFMAYAAVEILKRKNWKEGDLVWDWWRTGRLDVPKEFEAHFSTWQDAQARGDLEEAAAALTDLEGIGTLALPLFVEKAAAGKTDLIPAISRLTDGALEADATAQQVTAWWAKNKAKWTLPEEKPARMAEGPALPQQ
jgi:hypothetical protein